MKLTTKIAFFACIMFLFTSAAHASTYAVLPFTIHAPEGYGYLKQAVQSTLSARLFWQDKVAPVEGKITTKTFISPDEIKKIRKQLKADLIVWGTVTVVGDEITLEVKALDAKGETWARTKQGSVSRLTSMIQLTANELGYDFFERPLPRTSTRARPASINQMNSDIVINQSTAQDVYLNPQFRYQGAGGEDGSRIHSSRLPFTMVDFAVADLDGDGKNEIAILGEHKLHIYMWEQGKLNLLAETTVSMTNQTYSMRSIDLNGDGRDELIVSTFEVDNNRPTTYFYSYTNKAISKFADDAFYFASVAKLPPTFEKVLIGQRWDSIQLFQAGIHLLVKDGSRYVIGNKIQMPTGTNVFNFTWFPSGASDGGNKLVLLNNKERLQLYTSADTKLHLTMSNFSGSSVGMEHYKTVPGLGRNTNYELPSLYYAPMRMIAADLEHNGNFVLLVNKPISTASQFFDRYRFFPQGEIHALYWDGVGLGLKWKTRRIRGSVADLQLADFNNDGILDLVVGLNTHPGALGLKSRQCVLTAYPLDLTQANPNATISNTSFD